AQTALGNLRVLSRSPRGLGGGDEPAHRRGQHHVGVGLSAPRRHLARLAEVDQPGSGIGQRGRSAQDSVRERRQAVRSAVSAERGKETTMARIRHIAIRTPDPEKTAAFYKDVFGLKEVGQARTGCYLSDGHTNLAILKSRDEGSEESPRDAVGYAGIHHLGFM